MNEKEKIENQESNVEEKQYQFRKLKATDIGTMTKLIKKIGISRIKDCFKSEELNDFIIKTITNEENEGQALDEQNNDKIFAEVGFEVVSGFVQIIIESYSDCEPELYKLLSDVSNLSIEEVQNLDFEVFIDMLIDFFRKEEFMGFLKPVLKLLDTVD